jgi:hypothetical protein
MKRIIGSPEWKTRKGRTPLYKVNNSKIYLNHEHPLKNIVKVFIDMNKQSMRGNFNNSNDVRNITTKSFTKDKFEKRLKKIKTNNNMSTTKSEYLSSDKANTNTNLPFDVTEGLQKYSRIFVAKEVDPFRIVHCCEAINRDYLIFGEEEDGSKKLLFNSHIHFECCKCCDQCVVGFLCCGYACCDSIVFQLDYRRNGHPFYTQGFNIYKGCHCCDM